MRPKYWLYVFAKRNSLLLVGIVYIIYFIMMVLLGIIRPWILPLIDIKIKICLTFSAVWAIIGPFLVYKYFKEYHDIILALLKSRCNSKAMDLILKRNLQNNFLLNNGITIIWSGFLVYILLRYPDSLKLLCISGYKDVLYWVFVAIAVILTHLTAIGLSGVITNVWLIRALNKQSKGGRDSYLYNIIDVDKGILEELNVFCFRTALSFSTGVLFIPSLIMYMKYNDSLSAKYTISIAILVYSAFIFLSYFSPYKQINSSAEKYRENKYNAVEKMYNLAVLQNNHIESISLFLQMERIKNENYIPKSAEMTFKNIVAAIIPILVFIIDHMGIMRDVVEFLRK